MESKDSIVEFIKESNRIEGIHRAPTDEEIAEYRRFMALQQVTIDDLVQFVDVYQPGAKLRLNSSLNVRVGDHIAPTGGLGLAYRLENLLQQIAVKEITPFAAHCEYEMLHPFMDGNGRSGRMLWKWTMAHHNGYKVPLGFLHTFYYQTLDAQRLNRGE